MTKAARLVALWPGDEYVDAASTPGWHRKVSREPGILYDGHEISIFMPADEVAEALRGLGDKVRGPKG